MTEKSERTITLQKRVTVQTKLPRSHTTINLKNRSTRERKAILFMNLLWEFGYHREISKETMESYVEQFLGGFRTTKQAYLGHVKIVGCKGERRSVRKKGLFEKRRWAYFNPYKQMWTLNHQIVPLPYHYHESLVPLSPSPLPNDDECVSVFDNMEKISLTRSTREEVVVDTCDPDFVGHIGKKINNNNTCERENFSILKNHAENESIPTPEERRILKIHEDKAR